MQCLNVVSQMRKYGETSAFSLKTETFKELLVTLGCEVQEEDGNENDFEVGVDEYNLAYNILSVYNTYGDGREFEAIKEGLEEDFTADELVSLLNKLGGITYTMESMLKFYNEADKSLDVLSFSVF